MINTEKGVIIISDFEKTYTTTEVAEMLGMTDRTIRNYCKDKKIPHFKIGQKILITEKDLKEFILSCKIEKGE